MKLLQVTSLAELGPQHVTQLTRLQPLRSVESVGTNA
jgi:L-lactate dehydrogenase (cytochrome)